MNLRLDPNSPNSPNEEIEMPVDNINKIGLMNAIRKEHNMGLAEANRIATTVYWEIDRQQEEFIDANINN